ncbi:MAG TPA: glycerophosphodiester phosphodiesterase family protein [Streptosporangiaceae bacterium]|nr:glycerophosphodiester phosphodiesterase family protein [Streptosporangiaceae bacterium]
MTASISAHRGGAERARPGTYEAYEDAVTTGAEYAEFDLRRTADGELAVYHDGLAGGPGSAPRLVAELTYPELCAAAGYRVPLARDVMALLARHGLAGHLDLKETGYEADVIRAALAAFGDPSRFVATTLEDGSVRAIKTTFPQVKAALSLGRDLRELQVHRWPAVRATELAPLRRVRRCGADWVAVNYQLARLGVIRACHRAGVGVMVWTVDGDAHVDEFLADGRVGVLITNRPRFAIARRAELSGLTSPG